MINAKPGQKIIFKRNGRWEEAIVKMPLHDIVEFEICNHRTDGKKCCDPDGCNLVLSSETLRTVEVILSDQERKDRKARNRIYTVIGPHCEDEDCDFRMMGEGTSIVEASTIYEKSKMETHALLKEKHDEKLKMRAAKGI